MTDDLLSQLRTNNRTAWAHLYDSISGELRAYIARLGARSPDDVLGDTMMNVVRDLPRFTGTADELRPWIFRIAHNRVVDAARRKKSRVAEVSAEIDSELFEPYVPLSATPNLAELSDALNSLTVDQRAAVWLRYVTNLSLEDTAIVMSKTNEAVAALTHRALRQLRAQFSD
jgi:RNA polymerase sigma-70 factor (ECF subfamily)